MRPITLPILVTFFLAAGLMPRDLHADPCAASLVAEGRGALASIRGGVASVRKLATTADRVDAPPRQGAVGGG